MADGRHLWRVFDNLLNNIYKYAQAGSRVYLNVEHDGQDVRIIFRNMSAFPLEMSPEELEERFFDKFGLAAEERALIFRVFQ